MSDKFTEHMEVEKIGTLKPGDIGWGTCDGCEKNIHKFPGVLIQGVTQEAAKLLYEKVEIVPEGTKARMEEMAAANGKMRSQIEGLQKNVLEFFDSTNATVAAGEKISIDYAHLKNRVSELEASNAALLAALDDLIDECGQAEDCGLIDWEVMGKAREEAHKARGLRQCNRAAGRGGVCEGVHGRERLRSCLTRCRSLRKS